MLEVGNALSIDIDGERRADLGVIGRVMEIGDEGLPHALETRLYAARDGNVSGHDRLLARRQTRRTFQNGEMSHWTKPVMSLR